MSIRYYDIMEMPFAACDNCENKTIADGDWFARHGLEISSDSSMYRKLIDVKPKGMSVWAYMCTGKSISAL